jgi:hypothetical protein
MLCRYALSLALSLALLLSRVHCFVAMFCRYPEFITELLCCYPESNTEAQKCAKNDEWLQTNHVSMV